jgi:hypothetical protein
MSIRPSNHQTDSLATRHLLTLDPVRHLHATQGASALIENNAWILPANGLDLLLHLVQGPFFDDHMIKSRVVTKPLPVQIQRVLDPRMSGFADGDDTPLHQVKEPTLGKRTRGTCVWKLRLYLVILRSITIVVVA